MKIFKNTLFSFSGLLFLFLLSTGSSSVDALDIVYEDFDCYTVPTVCDQQNPDSYEDFMDCMSANGCRIDVETGG